VLTGEKKGAGKSQTSRARGEYIAKDRNRTTIHPTQEGIPATTRGAPLAQRQQRRFAESPQRARTSQHGVPLPPGQPTTRRTARLGMFCPSTGHEPLILTTVLRPPSLWPWRADRGSCRPPAGARCRSQTPLAWPRRHQQVCLCL
jgi:hypothetical protein